jgi:D-3-phosphoglycerate dehydrogenase
MNRPEVVIPDDYPPVMASSRAYRELKERAAASLFDTLPGSEDELGSRIAGAEIVINIRASSSFSARVFGRARRLRLLSIWGTGTDNVDLAAAGRFGVTVTNTPGVAARAVAEHAMALLFAAARRIPLVDQATRRGEWPRGEVLLLACKTLGVVGLGAIGREFARLGAAIGMQVIAWSPHPKPELGYESVPLPELLAGSDVVSLHLRLSPQTRGLIGPKEFALMKRSAVLINTARGAITDEAALIEALSTRRIAAAGLDVFETEPLPVGHPLTRLDNVVLTPHSAGIAPEVVEAGLALAVENIWSFLAGRPSNVVNDSPN